MAGNPLPGGSIFGGVAQTRGSVLLDPPPQFTSQSQIPISAAKSLASEGLAD
jgi:hypothetical protein